MKKFYTETEEIIQYQKNIQFSCENSILNNMKNKKTNLHSSNFLQKIHSLAKFENIYIYLVFLLLLYSVVIISNIY